MKNELVSRTTRGLFRDLMTDSTLGLISAAFQDEGFAPNPNCLYEDNSQRRTLTQEYLEAVDWADAEHVRRALRVFERLMGERLGSVSESAGLTAQSADAPPAPSAATPGDGP